MGTVLRIHRVRLRPAGGAPRLPPAGGLQRQRVAAVLHPPPAGALARRPGGLPHPDRAGRRRGRPDPGRRPRGRGRRAPADPGRGPEADRQAPPGRGPAPGPPRRPARGAWPPATRDATRGVGEAHRARLPQRLGGEADSAPQPEPEERGSGGRRRSSHRKSGRPSPVSPGFSGVSHRSGSSSGRRGSRPIPARARAMTRSCSSTSARARRASRGGRGGRGGGSGGQGRWPGATRDGPAADSGRGTSGRGQQRGRIARPGRSGGRIRPAHRGRPRAPLPGSAGRRSGGSPGGDPVPQPRRPPAVHRRRGRAHRRTAPGAR